MTIVSRFEWLSVATSTNDVVSRWLDEGVPEVCVAVADEQIAGRGRAGRAWTAPAGAALLLSAGFRPTWLAPDLAWRLSAVVSLAMAEACEAVVGLVPGTVRLKWPNDLVVDTLDRGVLKLGGVLGETAGLGTPDPRVVVGIGINAGWPRHEFPPELATSMTSLAELADTPEIDRAGLCEAFRDRLAPLVVELREGGFAAAAWLVRQLTDGRTVRLERPDGTAEVVHAVGVDPATGALLVRGGDAAGAVRAVLVGEIRHLRVADRATAAGRL